MRRWGPIGALPARISRVLDFVAPSDAGVGRPGLAGLGSRFAGLWGKRQARRRGRLCPRNIDGRRGGFDRRLGSERGHADRPRLGRSHCLVLRPAEDTSADPARGDEPTASGCRCSGLSAASATLEVLVCFFLSTSCFARENNWGQGRSCGGPELCQNRLPPRALSRGNPAPVSAVRPAPRRSEGHGSLLPRFSIPVGGRGASMPWATR